ncbi:STAS domain-containing protein [Metabacillus litoralis]|uniref:STAS domain-containing protein n=1 Tax=Metabacillus litoralis TaxID=152268 RepID=UPI001CFC85A1|nr:STAS domain-containing protein [Metabacillus litoralis]
MEIKTEIFKHINIESLLNSVGESLIFADKDYQIVWINDHARALLSKVGPYINVNNPNEFIGMNLNSFHGKRQMDIVQNGPFPYKTTIRLFNLFTATIIVDQLKSANGDISGFILTWKDITQHENELEERKRIIEGMYTPIIDTAIDSVLLVSLSGVLSEERLEFTKQKLLEAASNNSTDYIIVDFTGIQTILEEDIAFQLNQLVEALTLMGVETIFVGLNPKIVHNIVKMGIQLNAKTYKSFKQGVNYVWKQKGYELKKL